MKLLTSRLGVTQNQAKGGVDSERTRTMSLLDSLRELR